MQKKITIAELVEVLKTKKNVFVYAKMDKAWWETYIPVDGWTCVRHGLFNKFTHVTIDIDDDEYASCVFISNFINETACNPTSL